ncbi:MAG: YciI family protein [Actinomycetota bacterium]|nr:YciI family protein [Actinomycetota bacterium]
MPSYVLTFRGQPGRTPTAEEEAAWPAWFGQISASIADTGNRVGQARSVGYHGERDDVLSGYIVITAADFDAAVAIAQGCPGLQQGGSLEVGELVPA